jgi:hypothetical protein
MSVTRVPQKSSAVATKAAHVTARAGARRVLFTPGCVMGAHVKGKKKYTEARRVEGLPRGSQSR